MIQVPNLRLKLNAGLGMLEQVVTAAVYVVTFGYLFRTLGAESVGLLSLVLTLASVGQIANLGLGSGLLRLIPLEEARQTTGEISRLIETAMSCTFVLFVAFAVISYVPFRDYIMLRADPKWVEEISLLVGLASIYTVVLNVAAVVQAALSALQRHFVRNLISICTMSISLGVTLAMVPHFGVAGALSAMLTQAFLALVASCFALRKLVPGVRWLPFRFDWSKARGLLAFGVQMQLMGIAMALVEPLSRIYLAHFGTLAQVAIFAMAWRFVVQGRSVLFAMGYALVPSFGLLDATDKLRTDRIYMRFNQVFSLLTVATFGMLAVSAPAVGELWLGTRQPDFSSYTFMLLMGWLAHTLYLGPYLRSLAAGRLGASIAAHAMLAGSNAVLGWLAGERWGTMGVVAATAASLFVSGAFQAFFNARKFAVMEGTFAFRHDALAVVMGTAATISMLLSYAEWREAGMVSSLFIATTIGSVGLVMWVAWIHPGRKAILQILRP
jgi:O-antigen/teichoic acid export membrane protein